MRSEKLVRELFIIFILVASSFMIFSDFETVNATTTTFEVNDDYHIGSPGWNEYQFDSIQNAINAASSGDMIQIYEGTYSENLIINATKSNISLVGQDDASKIIINGGGVNDVIIVNASNITISTLTIKNSGSYSNNSGIRLTSNAGNCSIHYCIISNGEIGIFINSCNSNKILYNKITSNDREGIYLNNSNSNTITDNTITSNSHGIFAYNSDSNTISNCNIQINSQNGIYLNATCNSNTISDNNISLNSQNAIFFDDHCDSNIISNNQIHNNDYSGIRLENSSSNTLGSNTINSNDDYGAMISVGSLNIIHNSTINYNGDHGVFLFGDENSKILDNTLQRNTINGINLQNSESDIISRNRIINNSGYGIYLDLDTGNNQIYNNFFWCNADNAREDYYVTDPNQNIWNIPAVSGTNIIGGPKISGNYWEDFDEDSELTTDSDNDGLSDTGKAINNYSTDNGALLDTISPVIGSISASPSSQAQGSYTYISTTVTDNIEVKKVRLVVTDPNSQTSNFSIYQNKTGNIYTCNKQFSTIGDYSYHIYAKDPRNSVVSTTGSFSIHEGDPPTITDNSPSTGSPSNNFVFNVTVTSGDTSASNINVSVNWVHDTKNANDSMINTAGNYFTKTVTLDSSIDSLSYSIYAIDEWGNSIRGSTTTVVITDTQAPTISIEKHGESNDDYPGSFTFAATVTDDSVIDKVYIEYWYENTEKMIADMENTAGSYYQKVIIPTGSTDIVYCVIYANDTTGNIADTKNPYSNPGGPYTGYVVQTIIFNGTGSYDLDGNISSYEWDFGDGNTGNATNPTHEYSAKGNYTVTLTITDNDDNTNTVSTTITIISLTKITASTQTIIDLETEFNISLDEQFWGYDTDGDGKAETFVDPNGIIEVLHTGYLSINNHGSFLLAVNGDLNKIFIWDAETDTIINVTYQIGTVVDPDGDIDLEAGTTTLTVNTYKAAWTYIEITDHYQETSGLSITRSDGSSISSDMSWRRNSKIYILDDPDTTYYLIYSSSAILQDVVFSPNVGSTINAESPTITMSYTILVDIQIAEFVRLDPETYLPISSTRTDITLDLDTDDKKIYHYTPPDNLENGLYSIRIKAVDNKGNEVDNSMNYNYESYSVGEMGFPTTTLLMIFGGIIAFGAVVYFILKRKNISLESFVYIKNRKIIPFFKPVIIGPLKINLDDTKISKAEFYVNGALKETIGEAPYSWTWNETAFMKQKIETKIFDENGKSSSSGEMTFYMFNPTRPNK